MKLTKNLKAAIVKQFKDGMPIDYLAALYKQPIRRVEQVIRLKMIGDEIIGPARPPENVVTRDGVAESTNDAPLLAETSNFEPRTSNEAPDA